MMLEKDLTYNKREFWEQKWKEDPDSVRSEYGYCLVLGDREVDGRKVLDVGCGDLGHLIVPEAAIYFGVDISPTALQRARENCGNSRKYGFVLADATHGLPFPRNSFDYALSFDTITLLGSVFYKALEEMAKVAKDGVIFTVSHRDPVRMFIPDTPHTDLQYGTLIHDSNCEKVVFTEENVEELLRALDLKPDKIETLSVDNVRRLENPLDIEFIPSQYGDVKSRIYVKALKY